MKVKILCFGEIVIDLIEKQDGTLFPKVGGAPLNVAVGLSRLGEKVKFVTSIGNDWFGEYVHAWLKRNRIEFSARVATGLPTRTAVVFHDEKGERSFRFSPGLAAENVISPDGILSLSSPRYDVIYFGSLPFAKGNSLPGFKRLITEARRSGVATVYDPNIRLGLFDSPKAARSICVQLIELADIVRLNLDELHFLANFVEVRRTGSSLLDSVRKLRGKLPTTFFVTDGTNGSYARKGDKFFYSRALDVKTVDSTGCGDAYTAALISGFFGTRNSSDIDYAAILRLANAAGSLAATKLGGADSMPARNEIEKLLKSGLRGGDKTIRKILISKTRETRLARS